MSILEKILAAKKIEVEERKQQRTLQLLHEQIALQAKPRSLARALKRTEGQAVRVLAEIKRASPSAGPICPDAVPEEVAQEYRAGGASALSILTDEKFFDGRLEFLSRVRKAVELPLLRKDFVVDEYQLYEARAFGADAVLLIVAALSEKHLLELFAIATSLGMDALVEVHNAAEAKIAVSATRSAALPLIGVNHRDLKTFTVDTSLTGRLRETVPQNVVLVGESGIRNAADVVYMRESGADAVLVGESLMRAEDRVQALQDLVEAK